MSRTTVSTELRNARLAVSALFLTNGALFANLLPRYPEIKGALELDNVTYGIAIASFPAGALIAGLASGVVIRRIGSARAAVLGTVLTAVGIWAAGSAPSIAVFMIALFAGGAMDAITDVAQNAHGLRVQSGYRRSIINSFHAIWSVGAVLGGLMSAGAIAIELPLGVHLGISGLVFATVSLIALRFCLSGLDPGNSSAETAAHSVADADAAPPTAADPNSSAPVTDKTETGVAKPKRGRRRTGRAVGITLAALVLLAMAGTVVEDAAFSWGALYLGESLGAAPQLAASGYIALVGAQVVGRLLGDRMTDRLGQRTVARNGGIIIGVGMGLALAFPSVPGTILGFAAAGFGVATLVPAAMNEADNLPGLRPGTGLTLISWLMRLSFLLGPPLVGLVADNVSLRAGLFVLPLAGICAVLVSPVLRNRQTKQLV